jgi:hypothetical protein
MTMNWKGSTKMITFTNGGRLIEDVSELPNLKGAKIVFADFETTSCNTHESSVNPWHNCWPAGIAVTTDDTPGAWYAPVSHAHGVNLPEDTVIDWWCDIVSSCEMWSNHNIKYDAHVSANGWGILPECKLFCTLAHAKIIDSDRVMRGGYGLDALSKSWLGEDINAY